MATSGIVKTTAYDKRYIEFAWERTSYSIPDNTTTISWTLYSRGSGNNSQYKGSPFLVSIDGVQIYYSNTRITTKPDMKIASGTHTLNHNPDGSKSFSATVKAGIYYSAYNLSGSDTFTLDSIPRKATITAAPDINDEMESATIKYQNLLGENVDSIRICIDGIANYQALSPTDNTYTFTFNDTEREVMRNKTLELGSAEFVAEWVIETVIKGEKYYDRLPRVGTIVNCEPEITYPFIYEVGENLGLTGSETRVISGHNDMWAEALAEAKKGASIKSFTLTNGGITKDFIIDESFTGGSIDFQNITDGTFIFTAIDSRNIKVELPHVIEVVPYFDPSINLSARIELSGEETAKITLEVKGSFFNQNFGYVDNELAFEYRLNNGEWTPIDKAPTLSGNQYQLTDEIDGLDYRNTHTIEVRVSDLVVSEVKSVPITLKAIPVFDWSETDFNFNVPIKFNKVQMMDFIVEEGTEDGWAYRKWSSGKAECWKRLQITTGVSGSWGGLYTSGSLAATNLTYPFEFAETPVLTVSLMPFGSGGLVMATGNGYGNEKQTGPYEIARGTTLASGQFLLAYHAMGKWK